MEEEEETTTAAEAIPPLPLLPGHHPISTWTREMPTTPGPTHPSRPLARAATVTRFREDPRRRDRRAFESSTGECVFCFIFIIAVFSLFFFCSHSPFGNYSFEKGGSLCLRFSAEAAVGQSQIVRTATADRRRGGGDPPNLRAQCAIRHGWEEEGERDQTRASHLVLIVSSSPFISVP